MKIYTYLIRILQKFVTDISIYTFLLKNDYKNILPIAEMINILHIDLKISIYMENIYPIINKHFIVLKIIYHILEMNMYFS